MTNSRIIKARQAYNQKDKSASIAVHSPSNIEKSLHEPHNRGFDLPEIILGGQDGLVNVLGIVLGVAAAANDVRIVVAAGLAAAFAESIAMAGVAYTSTRSQADYYQSEKERERWEIENLPDHEKEEVRQIYKKRGFEGELLEAIVKKITSNKEVWLDLMMSEELKIEPIGKDKAVKAAFIVGLSAIVGSLIPLLPFFVLPLRQSIIVAVVLTAVTLVIVGYYKAKVTVGKPMRSAVEMLVIGMVSAAIGYFVGLIFKVPVLPA